MYDLEFSNKTQMFFEVVLHYHKSKGKLTEDGVLIRLKSLWDIFLWFMGMMIFSVIIGL